MKVLIADDDAVWRRILQAIISKHGFDTHIASNGAQAWRVLQGDDAPQVAILDWMMPELDGVELCRMLRERERHSYIYLILLTAKSDREDVIKGLRAGADDYLTKPVDAEELFARIRTGERVVKLQRELRSANRANELLLSNAPFGIASFSESAAIVRANPAFLRIIKSRGPLEATSFDLRNVFVDAGERQAAIQYIQTRTAFDSVEVKWKNEERQNIAVRLLGRPMPESDSDERYFLVAEDVTETRQLEAQMRHSQRMEAIGRLAGGVAHDINNVLQAVMLPAELLLMTEERDNSRRKLESIVEVAKRGASVAQQLLAFSRRQVVQPRVIDVNQALKEMQQMLRQLIREDVAINYSFSPRRSFVRIDPGQFVQIMINLVVNARDAMPDGGNITISIEERARTMAPETGSVVISVRDTGCGIAPGIRDRIFEPFFTTKEFGKGTGLGLATVYGIVHQCGGSVEVISEPGRGSSFRVCLPQTGREVESVIEKSLMLRGTERVLLVGAPSSQRSLAERVLSSHGYAVKVAANRTEAERLVDPPCDLLMVENEAIQDGGLNWIESLRATSPDLRVIFTSEYPDAAIDPTLFDNGTVHLQKPFRAEELLLTVRNLLDGFQGYAEARISPNQASNPAL